jgi:hypothetical protein
MLVGNSPQAAFGTPVHFPAAYCADLLKTRVETKIMANAVLPTELLIIPKIGVDCCNKFVDIAEA